MYLPSLAGLDQEHFGLVSEGRLTSCHEGSRYLFDTEGLPINPQYDTLVSVTENTADEGIAMLRSLWKIGEFAASPLLDLELLQLRKAPLRSKAFQRLLHLVLGLVFTHQHSEPQPAEHLCQAFCSEIKPS